jgi:hypothetical protein
MVCGVYVEYVNVIPVLAWLINQSVNYCAIKTYGGV